MRAAPSPAKQQTTNENGDSACFVCIWCQASARSVSRQGGIVQSRVESRLKDEESPLEITSMSAKVAMKDADANSAGTLTRQDDVVQLESARAGGKHEDRSKFADAGEVPPKKRKTRRGKCKRRYAHPYIKEGMKSNKMIKPEAPYNSNRFLIEDHGSGDDIVERLRNNDQISTSTITRTRDSSFSIDSEGDFYSTPDDEEEFLIKDFDDQYESLQAERLHSMSKNELIQEYLLLETRVDSLNKRLVTRGSMIDSDDKSLDEMYTVESQNFEFQREIERLTIENENLKRENETLKNKLSRTCSSDSADSETDSSESCSTTSTSSLSKPSSPVVDYAQTNGHSPAAVQEAV